MAVIARFEHRHDDGSVFWASEGRARRPSHCPCGAELSRVEYVDADTHQEAIKALRDVRAELVTSSGRPSVSAPWCKRAISRIDTALSEEKT